MELCLYNVKLSPVFFLCMGAMRFPLCPLLIHILRMTENGFMERSVMHVGKMYYYYYSPIIALKMIH